MCYLSEGAGTGQNQGVVSAHDRPLLDGTLHCPKPMRTSIWGACDQRKEDGIGLKSIFKNLFGCIKLKEMRQRRRTEDFRLEKPSFSLRWLPEESCVWISRRLTSWEVKTATRKKKSQFVVSFISERQKKTQNSHRASAFHGYIYPYSGCFYMGIRYEIKVFPKLCLMGSTECVRVLQQTSWNIFFVVAHA